LSFPRSAWERTVGRSASREVLNLANATQSVGPCVPTRSVGTRRRAPMLTRREWLKLGAAGVTAFSMSGWIERLAAEAARNPQRKRACILLWMNGGPSQMDTFDLKPGHKNGGPFKEIQTNAPGVRFSEHLPKLAKHGDKLAIIRSMSTKE